MNGDKIKCYIYTRVSTALQVDGYSLDAQRETLLTLFFIDKLININYTVANVY
jgi:DNA invertase Pin-like site-specific DNA recombinase